MGAFVGSNIGLFELSPQFVTPGEGADGSPNSVTGTVASAHPRPIRCGAPCGCSRGSQTLWMEQLVPLSAAGTRSFCWPGIMLSKLSFEHRGSLVVEQKKSTATTPVASDGLFGNFFWGRGSHAVCDLPSQATNAFVMAQEGTHICHPVILSP